MNNDQCIVIKSRPQPDRGEGDSERQGTGSNVSAEESPLANMRGDEQKPSEAIRSRDESATQDEVLYLSYGKGRRLGARAWKVRGITPGEPQRVLKRFGTGAPARGLERGGAVSREHSSRRRNESGVAADGLPVQRMNCRNHPGEGSNGARAEWPGK